MKCSEVEKRIYLYRELNEAQRKQADEHIAQCASCRSLATQAFHHQELIKNIRPIKAVVNNPEWLTRQIMNVVERKEKRVSFFDDIVTLLDSLFVRYAFSLASLLLIGFFVVEQQRPDYTPPVAQINMEQQQGTVLNMNTVSNTYLKQRESKEARTSISGYAYYKSEWSQKNL